MYYIFFLSANYWKTILLELVVFALPHSGPFEETAVDMLYFTSTVFTLPSKADKPRAIAYIPKDDKPIDLPLSSGVDGSVWRTKFSPHIE